MRCIALHRAAALHHLWVGNKRGHAVAILQKQHSARRQTEKYTSTSHLADTLRELGPVVKTMIQEIPFNTNSEVYTQTCLHPNLARDRCYGNYLVNRMSAEVAPTIINGLYLA